MTRVEAMTIEGLGREAWEARADDEGCDCADPSRELCGFVFQTICTCLCHETGVQRTCVTCKQNVVEALRWTHDPRVAAVCADCGMPVEEDDECSS